MALGLHGGEMLTAFHRAARPLAGGGRWALRIFGTAAAGYGAVAFVRHGLPDYLFYRTQFGFFDYSEPLVFFFADYLAILALFVFAGYWLARLAQSAGKTQKKCENSAQGRIFLPSGPLCATIYP